MSIAVCDILDEGRVILASEASPQVRSKEQALRELARLLAKGAEEGAAERIEGVLREREKLQSTGVGSGVAIPHGSLDSFRTLVGAVLLCPQPIPFDAIDGEPVSILFAVVGPRKASGEHLQALARVSRLLRSEAFRRQLLRSPSGGEAFRLLAHEESRVSAP